VDYDGQTASLDVYPLTTLEFAKDLAAHKLQLVPRMVGFALKHESPIIGITVSTLLSDGEMTLEDAGVEETTLLLIDNLRGLGGPKSGYSPLLAIDAGGKIRQDIVAT
jgi:hypothetical protein